MIYRSNQNFQGPLCDSWGRAKWEEKKPEKEEKKEEEGSGRKVGPRLKHHLGAIDHGDKLDVKIYGAKLGVGIYGVKLPTKSPPRLCWAQDLGARIYGVEKCKLGTTNDGAELRV